MLTAKQAKELTIINLQKKFNKIEIEATKLLEDCIIPKIRSSCSEGLIKCTFVLSEVEQTVREKVQSKLVYFGYKVQYDVVSATGQPRFLISWDA